MKCQDQNEHQTDVIDDLVDENKPKVARPTTPQAELRKTSNSQSTQSLCYHSSSYTSCNSKNSSKQLGSRIKSSEDLTHSNNNFQQFNTISINMVSSDEADDYEEANSDHELETANNINNNAIANNNDCRLNDHKKVIDLEKASDTNHDNHNGTSQRGRENLTIQNLNNAPKAKSEDFSISSEKELRSASSSCSSPTGSNNHSSSSSSSSSSHSQNNKQKQSSNLDINDHHSNATCSSSDFKLLNDHETKRKLSANNNDSLEEELKVLKYELKEKDLDIVQLQKEINELDLENKMLKVKIPFIDDQLWLNNLKDEQQCQYDHNNPYLKELLMLQREKDVAVEELIKAQDLICKLKCDTNSKSIDLYDPNNPEILNKKIKALEKQLQELEDDNEKYVNDLSTVETNLEKAKSENCDLKLKLNESRLYKQHEEQYLIELANLKNELAKAKFANTQLMEQNKQLENLFNSRCNMQPPSQEPKTVATQTCLPKSDMIDKMNGMENMESADYQRQSQRYSQIEYPTGGHEYSSHLIPNSTIQRASHSRNCEAEVGVDFQFKNNIQNYKKYNLATKLSLIDQITNTSRLANEPNQSNNYNLAAHSSTFNSASSRNDPYSTANSFDSFNSNTCSRQQSDNAGLSSSNSNARPLPHQSNNYSHSNLSRASLVNSQCNKAARNYDNYATNYYSNYANTNQNYDNVVADANKYAHLKSTANVTASCCRNMHSSTNSCNSYCTVSANNPASKNLRSTYSSSLETLDACGRDSDSCKQTYSKQEQDHEPPLETTGIQSRKSLRINVMRDLKSVQRLKDAFLAGKKDRCEQELLKSTDRAGKRVLNCMDNISPTIYPHVHRDFSNYGTLRTTKQTLASSSSSLAPSASNVSVPELTQSYQFSSSSKACFDDNALKNHSQCCFTDCQEGEGNNNSETNRNASRSKSVDRGHFNNNINTSLCCKDLTQSHTNKDMSCSLRKRPFVPVKPDDIRIGDFVKFSRPGGKISKGMVKYIGPLPDRDETYYGLELDTEEGKHDGVYLDKRYFNAKNNKGVFVAFSKVVMAWG